MEQHDHNGDHLVRDAVITFVAVVLAVAALDDITTDSATSFPVERTMLVMCTVWFLVVAWRLWNQGRRGLAVVSFGLVTIAALAQPTLGPRTATMQVGYLAIVGYLATLGALAWLLLLSGLLAGFAWRQKRMA